MAECKLLKGCPFFNDKLKEMPALADQYKRKYCLGDHTGCARFIVFSKLGKSAVPPDLFPNQQPRARQIIQGL